MIKKFKVFDTYSHDVNVYDYDITIVDTDKGTEYTLYSSHSSEWTPLWRGKKLLSIVDTGNGYIISNRYTKEVGYDEMACLYTLLRLIDSQSKIYRGEIQETGLCLPI